MHAPSATRGVAADVQVVVPRSMINIVAYKASTASYGGKKACILPPIPRLRPVPRPKISAIVAQPDLILLLKVNPFLRKREKLRNQIKDELKERLGKTNFKFYSTFHKTLKGLVRFIIMLRGKKDYYKKKDDFLTISQVEKTGFKFGLKVSF